MGGWVGGSSHEMINRTDFVRGGLGWVGLGWVGFGWVGLG